MGNETRSSTSKGIDQIDMGADEKRRAQQELSMVENAVDAIASVADRINEHVPAPAPLSETAKELEHVNLPEDDRRRAQFEMNKVEHAVDAIAAAADRILHHDKK